MQQVLEALFGSVVVAPKRLPTVQWLEWQFIPSLCYPISHMLTNTTACYPHTKCIKVYTISGVNSNDCTIFYTISHLGVWITRSLFKHLKEMEAKLCKIQGDSWYSLCSYAPGKTSEIALASLQSGRSSETANKGCLFTVSSSTRSRHNLMTLKKGDPNQTQAELVNTLWNSSISDILDVKSLCHFKRQQNKFM